MKSISIIQILLAVLIAIISGFVVEVRITNKSLSNSMILLKYQMSEMKKDRDIDTEQNRRLTEQRETDKKFWKLHSAEKKEIDKLRVAMGLTLTDWPELSEHLHE